MRPRRASPQAEADVTDVSSEAARKGEQPYTEWSSERAFVLSTAAAGVGLGNLWRFPIRVGENGGASFLIAYVVAVALVAVPFAALEIAIGRLAHGSVIATFRRLGRPLVAVGWAVFAVTLLVDSYYFVVTGWTLGYAFESTFGEVPDFDAFTSGYDGLRYLGVTCLLVGGVLAVGIAGIERFARVVVPLLVVALVGLAVLGLSGDGRDEALAFLFRGDAAALTEAGVWRSAFGQAFFSLMIGQGYLITYGSHLPERVNVVRSIGAVAAINTAVAVLASVALFPFVFAAGLDPAGGSELAFTTLPRAFERTGQGAWLAPSFFWLLFLAAFSSCLGGAKVVTAGIREAARRVSRRPAVAIGVAAIAVLGVPSALSYAAPAWTLRGMPVLDFVDEVVGTSAVLAVGLVSTGVLAWRLSPGRWRRQLGLRRRRLGTGLVWAGRVGVAVLAVLFVAATL